MRDDQNWYSQDFDTPKPGRGAGWMIAIVLVISSISLLIGFLWFMIVGMNGGGLAGVFFGGGRDEETQEELTVRLKPIRDEYENAMLGNGMDQLSAEEAAEVNAAIAELTQALISTEDSQFAALIDKSAFESRVRHCDVLSGTAVLNFRSEFRSWQEYYIPVYAERIQIVSVSHEPDSDILRVATFAYSSLYPERFVWYYRKSGNRLRLVDWMAVDDASLASATAARNYTSAYLPNWDAYVDLFEEDFSSIDEDGIRRLANQVFPPLVRSDAIAALARTTVLDGRYELTIELLDQLRAIRPLPIERWHRARCLFDLGKPTEALQALDEYVQLVGSGIDEQLFRAEICEQLGRLDDARDFYLRVISFDPDADRLYGVAQLLKADDAERLASCLDGLSDQERPTMACLWATNLLTLGRDDLIDPILQIARTGSRTSPEYLAVEARLAEERDDRAEVINKYREAYEAAGPDHENYHAWVYSWASALDAEDRGEEAVRESPNPAVTFYNLAIEDGYVMVPSKKLKAFAKGLAESAPKPGEAQEATALWQQIAEGLVAMEDDDFSRAQAIFEATARSIPEDAFADAVAPMIQTASWSIPDWLTQAAAQTGRVDSAMEALKDDDDYFNALAFNCADAELAEPLRKVLEYGRTNNLGESQRGYFEGILLALDGDSEGARNKMTSFLRRAESDENLEGYFAARWLAQDAVEHESWRSLIERMPYSIVLGNLSGQLSQRNRLAEVIQLIGLARDAGIPATETDGLLVDALYEIGDWSQLARFADTWEPSDTEEPYFYGGYDPVPEQLLDAFLALGEFENAEAFIEKHDAQSEAWAARLHVAKGDVEAVLGMLNQDATYSRIIVSSLYSNPVTRRVLAGDEWMRFRESHPASRDSYDDMSDHNRFLVVTCSTDNLLTLPDLTAAIHSISPSAEFESLPPSENSADESKTAPASTVAWRVTVDDRAFLIASGTGTWDERGSSAGVDEDAWELSPELRKRWRDHSSWFHVEIEDGGPVARRHELTESLGRLAASIVKSYGIENVSLVASSGDVAPVDERVLNQLQQGQIQSFRDSETAYIPSQTTESLTDQWEAKSKRQRALKKHVRSCSAEPKDLFVTVSKIVSRNRYDFPLSVIRIDTPLQPVTIHARYPDHPAVSPRMRDTIISISPYDVEDWEQR